MVSSFDLSTLSPWQRPVYWCLRRIGHVDRDRQSRTVSFSGLLGEEQYGQLRGIRDAPAVTGAPQRSSSGGCAAEIHRVFRRRSVWRLLTEHPSGSLFIAERFSIGCEASARDHGSRRARRDTLRTMLPSP